MVFVAKVTKDHLDTARYESKKPVEISDDDTKEGMALIVRVLRLALIRTINITGDIHNEWVTAMVLFNHVTWRAPIASLTGNSKHGRVEEMAFKLADGSNGHAAVISMYDHPDFPTGDDHNYRELAKLVGMDKVFSLMSIVLRRLLSGHAALYDIISGIPKEGFVFAVFELLDNYFLVDEQSVENLRDRWYANRHITGSNMRQWLKANDDMVGQHNIQCKQMVPPHPKINPREEARHLLRNINTNVDSVYDNVLSKVQDSLDDSKVTARQIKIHHRQLIKTAMAKYPDTNYLPTSVGELGDGGSANSGTFMVSEFYQGGNRGTKRVAGGGVMRIADDDSAAAGAKVGRAQRAGRAAVLTINAETVLSCRTAARLPTSRVSTAMSLSSTTPTPRAIRRRRIATGRRRGRNGSHHPSTSSTSTVCVPSSTTT